VFIYLGVIEEKDGYECWGHRECHFIIAQLKIFIALILHNLWKWGSEWI
jgi:hypothetical protein